jgi:multimeric flavodoxin WrbA
MKVIAFLGSPRAGGNTDTLTLRLLDGAKAAGHETESFAIRSQKISPCLGCDRCWEKGRPCVINDDMSRAYDLIAASDVLVFATPVYWYGPTAQMKTFIDRLVVFNRPESRSMIEGKSAILVTAYEEEGPSAAELLIKMFEMSFAYLGVKFVDKLIVDGVGPKGAVLQKPETMERAYAIGERIK